MRFASLPLVLGLLAPLAAASPAAAAPTADPAPSSLAVVVDREKWSVDSAAGDLHGPVESAPPNRIWLSNILPNSPVAAPTVTATVTIDASGLKDLVDDIEVPCDPDGDLIGVCEKIKPVERGTPRLVGAVKLGRAKTSKVGVSAQVRVTARTEDGSRVEQLISVDVPEAGIKADRTLLPTKGVRPGSTVRVPGGFTNHSRTAQSQVIWSMELSRGLSFPGTFRNCTSSKDSETHITSVRCLVRGPFAPHKSYDLDLGPIQVGDTAMRESVSQRVEGPYNSDGPGKGPELTATPRTRPDSSVVEDFGRHRQLRTTVDTTHSADIVATGAVLKGKPGDRVTTTLTVRNHGPGEPAFLLGEPGYASRNRALVLVVPRGTTVVKAPHTCNAYKTSRPTGGTDDPLGSGRPGGRSYACETTDSFLPVGKRFDYTFTFRIDKASGYGAGRVETLEAGQPSPGNSSAALLVDVPQPMSRALRAVVGSVLLLLCCGVFFLIHRRRSAGEPAIPEAKEA
ncbi:hypothetical protein ACFY8H_06570 [Streptomyces bacillaris]|uniref:hypothetical protein n=1 Tax=Streptomyces bacillaris TaxID=68179 RepID=UPI003681869A